jgi:hypothetical protein
MSVPQVPTQLEAAAMSGAIATAATVTHANVNAPKSLDFKDLMVFSPYAVFPFIHAAARRASIYDNVVE